MLKSKYFLPILVFLFLFSFTGCEGQSTDTSSEKTSEEPPTISPPHALVPEAPGNTIIGTEPFLLDISNMEYGYFTAIGTASANKLNLQLTGEDGVTYSYFLAGGDTAAIPFSAGSGTYSILTYENIDGSQYAALYSESIDVKLDNEFYPFLYPNQYVDFTPESECSKLALSLLPENSSDSDILQKVYEYVTSHISYDTEKAATVECGYLPDVDDTLSSGTGICFDFAALTTAMLRTWDIPCKLQIGYSNDVKHAWIDVYLKEKGWIDQAVFFDGNSWSLMDPTFASAYDKETLKEFVGDGTNYTLQFSR